MNAPSYPRGLFGSALSTYDRLIRAAVKVAEYFTIAIAFFITAAMILAVFFRFGLNSSIGWSDEICSLLLSVMMFFVIGIGMHERIHIGVGVLFDQIPSAGRVVLDIILNVLSGLFFLIVFVGGLKVADIGLGMQLATVELPRGLFQYAAPIGAGFAFAVCVNNILKVAFGGDRPHMNWGD